MMVSDRSTNSRGDSYLIVFFAVPPNFVAFSSAFRRGFDSICRVFQLLFTAFLINFIPNAQDLAERDKLLNERIEGVTVEAWSMQLGDGDRAAARVDPRADPDVEPFLGFGQPDCSGDPLVRREVDASHLARRRHGAIRPFTADAGDGPAGFAIRPEPREVRRRYAPPPNELRRT